MASISLLPSLMPREDSDQQYQDSGLPSAIIATVTLFLILIVSTLVLRVYTRIIVLEAYGWEEWTMCLAVLGQIGLCSSILVSLQFGLMRPMDQMTPSKMSSIAKLSNAMHFLLTPTTALAKLSILLQLIRLFTPFPESRKRYGMYAFTVFNMLWFLSDYCIDISRCFPHSRTLAQPISGSCVLFPTKTVVNGVVSMVVDFMMLALPMFWVGRLRLERGRKVTAYAVFTVGILACVASTLRLVYAIKFWREDAEHSIDSTMQVTICMVAEATAGIICGNLPSLPAFVKHLRAKRQTTKGRRRKKRLVGSEITAVGHGRRYEYPSFPDQLPDHVFIREVDAIHGKHEPV